MRWRIFSELESLIPLDTNPDRGRRGMNLWRILVLGCVRLSCNYDYDKLQDIVNNHKNIRQMLGHGLMDNDQTYPLQTLKDNVKLLTPEILDKINILIVEEGHKLLVKKKTKR